MNIKYIKIDFNNIKSIKNAEKKKSLLENKGYSLVLTKSGFNNVILKYIGN